MKQHIYEVYIKKDGGWSYRDTLDPIDGRAPTKEDYIKILEADNEQALIKEITEADDFKTVEI